MFGHRNCSGASLTLRFFQDGKLETCPADVQQEPTLAQRHIILIEARRRQIYGDRTFPSLFRRS